MLSSSGAGDISGSVEIGFVDWVGGSDDGGGGRRGLGQTIAGCD